LTILLHQEPYARQHHRNRETPVGGRRRTIGKADYQARGVLYLRVEAHFVNLLKLP
jgi:hypothetical protein